MIASLTGRLKRKANDYLVVDVAGVGYQVQVPLSTYCSIPEIGDEVSLHIHTYVREDSLLLFGFLEEPEKEMFLLLMGVSGIGPKLALSVLSCLSVNDLCSAICSSDDSKLCTISGIGKKTAARMVLELKDKIKLLAMDRPEKGMKPAVADDVEDAISALVNLGYKKPLAEDVLKKIKQKKPGSSIEYLIREALSALMKK
jgi:Holliday junction DNA helicase RuvA